MCKEFGIDIFIDDSPKHIDSLTAAGIKTFIMNSFVNYDYSNKKATRVYSFPEFLYEVNEYIKYY